MLAALLLVHLFHALAAAFVAVHFLAAGLLLVALFIPGISSDRRPRTATRSGLDIV
jgi:hypothetical protein